LIDEDIRGILAERIAAAPPPPLFERLWHSEPSLPTRTKHVRWMAPSALMALVVLAAVVLWPARAVDRTQVFVGQQPPVASSVAMTDGRVSGVPAASLSAGGQPVEVKDSPGCPNGDGTLCVTAAGPLLRQAPVLEMRRGTAIDIAFAAGRVPVDVTARVMPTPDLRQTQTFSLTAANPTRLLAELPGGSYYLMLITRWTDQQESTYIMKLHVLS